MQTTSRGFTIDYTVDGAGAPLLLIAGTLSAARHWREFGYTETLTQGWRVVNVDPLGHGASDVPHDADSYDAAGVIADLVAVLDAEGIDRATVWGYSRGGWLAYSLASRYPERVDRLVVGAYAMNAHQEEVGRLLVPLARFLRQGNWSALWQAFGVTDRKFQQMMETSNDPLPSPPRSRVRSARPGSSIPPQSVAPQRITLDRRIGSCRTCVRTSTHLGQRLTSLPVKLISDRSSQRLNRCSPPSPPGSNVDRFTRTPCYASCAAVGQM